MTDVFLEAGHWSGMLIATEKDLSNHNRTRGDVVEDVLMDPDL